MAPPYQAPVLSHILRQHAEQAAFLWTVYDRALLHPEDNPDMDLADLVERLEAHLDGLRVAGADGLRMAEERFAEYPEAGELFVVRMLSAGGRELRVADLDLARTRRYLQAYTSTDHI
jgi:hypothetical protein